MRANSGRELSGFVFIKCFGGVHDRDAQFAAKLIKDNPDAGRSWHCRNVREIFDGRAEKRRDVRAHCGGVAVE